MIGGAYPFWQAKIPFGTALKHAYAPQLDT